MVEIIKQDNKNLHKCEECGLLYEEADWAQKCEDWCAKNKSCNLEIIKHSTSS